MYAPAEHDEITTITNYLDQQLEALRAAVVGLTDEQARERPCRSALSVGGLLTHATDGMQGAIHRLTGGDPAPLDEAAYGRYLAAFAVADDVPVADALAAFDELRPQYLAAVAATDPDAVVVEPPAPWDSRFEPTTIRARYYLVHQVEEMARHAGHADILREQIDGLAVPRIVLSEAGAPANSFFEPYRPEPGTIGA
jgi:hypothetical protein